MISNTVTQFKPPGIDSIFHQLNRCDVQMAGRIQQLEQQAVVDRRLIALLVDHMLDMHDALQVLVERVRRLELIQANTATWQSGMAENRS